MSVMGWNGKEEQPAGDSYPLLVTAGVIRRDDAVLIARRQSGPLAGLWEFPGGKLEPGESPEECLARELREELDLDVEVGDIFCVVYHRYPGRPVLLLAYSCRTTGDSGYDLTAAACREQAPSLWVRVADLHRYAFAPADRPIAAKLRQSVRARLSRCRIDLESAAGDAGEDGRGGPAP